ncbi:MAG: ABC transporter substrate-binding protein [Sphingomonas fennica]
MARRSMGGWATMSGWWRALFALAMLAFATAASAAPGKGEVVVGLQLEPPNLDPTTGASAATDEVVSGTILEGLTTLDRAGQPRPLLAAGWQVSADGRTIRFRLRPGIVFADGTPLTAAVARASLLRAIAPGSTNAQAPALRVIERIAAPGPLDLILHLARPDADLPRTLAYGDAAIVAPGNVADLAVRPIGTGPFALGEWRRGDSLTLVRNPRYRGPPAASPRIRFRFLTDPVAAFAAVRAREVDVYPDFPAPEAMARLKALPGLTVTIGPTQAEVILALNNARPPFDSLPVRRAVAMAIDRRAIIDGAMAGYGTPIGSHFPPQDPDYVDLTGRYPHDPAAAQAVLSRLPPVTLALPPPPYARRAGEIVAAQLRAAGLSVRIEPLEWAQWLERVYGAHAFDMTIVAHVEPADYDIYARSDYYFGYDGHAVARLIDALKQTRDPARRHALLAAIQRRIADDAVNGFLFQMPRLGVSDARLADLWADTPVRSLDLARVHFTGGGAGRAAATGAGATLPWGAIGLGAALLLAGAAAIGLGARALLRRAALLLVTLALGSVAIFLLVQVAPGDPAQVMMGTEATPAATAALARELGLEGAPYARYLRWAAGLLTGDLGISYTYRVAVAGLVAERLAVSVPLALLATALSLIVAIPAALAAALRPGGGADRLLAVAAPVGLAVPAYWLGILLILAFGGTIGAGGFPGWQAGAGAALTALLLPAIALAVPQAAVLARVTRAALGRELGQRYMLTMRATGAGDARLLLDHALPNAAAPVLAVLGLQLPFLLAGAVIVESIFALPGLGRLILQAIAQRDLIVVQSAAMLMVAAAVAASFLADLAAAAIDPRVRR